MNDVKVKSSIIEGKGVFAARDFKKGDVVIKWDVSHELTDAQVKNLSKEERKHVTFLNNKYILMQPPACYVNHSCDSNTHMKNFCDVAKRDIKKDEEITGEYSEVETPGFEMKCNCGSEHCRKIIKKN